MSARPIIGKYEGALCSRCNLLCKYKHELALVSFNGSGFDYHLLLEHLENPRIDLKKSKVIAKSSEKFIQIELVGNEEKIPELKSTFNRYDKRSTGNRKVRLRFIDAAQFISGSLDKLSSNLRQEGASQFDLLRQCIPMLFPGRATFTTDEENLILSKIPYPYRALASEEDLKDGTKMPDREMFDNYLKHEKISDKDFELVHKICETFQIPDFRQYTRVYCVLDSILLAIVWEQFRSMGIEYYSIDPTYVCTTSGYAWNAFLCVSKIQLDFIRDKRMMDMVNDGIKGGSSFCTQHIVQANYPESMLGYGQNKPDTRLVYFDVVSLYATAMLNKLPHSQFELVGQEALESIDWENFNCDEDTGYILKVDLEYPPETQDRTIDFPLAPSRHSVCIEELSDRQR